MKTLTVNEAHEWIVQQFPAARGNRELLSTLKSLFQSGRISGLKDAELECVAPKKYTGGPSFYKQCAWDDCRRAIQRKRKLELES